MIIRMKNPQISPSGRVSPQAPLDLVHWIKDWIHYPSWLPRGWRQQTSILGYVVLLCTSLLISDLSVEETWLQKRASSAKWDSQCLAPWWGWVASPCSCVLAFQDQASWIPPAWVSCRWQTCMATLAIQSPPTVAVATGTFHLGWYLLAGTL